MNCGTVVSPTSTHQDDLKDLIRNPDNPEEIIQEKIEKFKKKRSF